MPKVIVNCYAALRMAPPRMKARTAPVPAHLITFIVNIHAALGAASPRMKARWLRACALRHLPPVCLRSTPVGAKRLVYAPLRSLLDKRHRRLATLARSTPHSYRLVGKCPRFRPSELVRLCVHLSSFHSKRTCRRPAASL